MAIDRIVTMRKAVDIARIVTMSVAVNWIDVHECIVNDHEAVNVAMANRTVVVLVHGHATVIHRRRRDAAHRLAIDEIVDKSSLRHIHSPSKKYLHLYRLCT